MWAKICPRNRIIKSHVFSYAHPNDKYTQYLINLHNNIVDDDDDDSSFTTWSMNTLSQPPHSLKTETQNTRQQSSLSNIFAMNYILTSHGANRKTFLYSRAKRCRLRSIAPLELLWWCGTAERLCGYTIQIIGNVSRCCWCCSSWSVSTQKNRILDRNNPERVLTNGRKRLIESPANEHNRSVGRELNTLATWHHRLTVWVSKCIGSILK